MINIDTFNSANHNIKWENKEKWLINDCRQPRALNRDRRDFTINFLVIINSIICDLLVKVVLTSLVIFPCPSKSYKVKENSCLWPDVWSGLQPSTETSHSNSWKIYFKIITPDTNKWLRKCKVKTKISNIRKTIFRDFSSQKYPSFRCYSSAPMGVTKTFIESFS